RGAGAGPAARSRERQRRAVAPPGEAVKTVAITGSGSGMGAALAARLEANGDRVIGIDVKNAEIEADLSTVEGRAAAIERVGELSGGALDGLVTLAGLAGLPERPASLLISVNYFGTVEML